MSRCCSVRRGRSHGLIGRAARPRVRQGAFGVAGHSGTLLYKLRMYTVLLDIGIVGRKGAMMKVKVLYIFEGIRVPGV